jgi:glycosyltransferase involved in cell wall biosynthesis
MVADYMWSHHFLVISSQSETFGLVSIEALACGRPVLSTRCGGPEEVIRGSEYGELVDNSVEDLAKGLVTMAARIAEFDPTLLHDYARRNYGLEVIAARLKETYLQMLGRRKTSED